MTTSDEVLGVYGPYTLTLQIVPNPAYATYSNAGPGLYWDGSGSPYDISPNGTEWNVTQQTYALTEIDQNGLSYQINIPNIVDWRVSDNTDHILISSTSLLTKEITIVSNSVANTETATYYWQPLTLYDYNMVTHSVTEIGTTQVGSGDNYYYSITEMGAPVSLLTPNDPHGDGWIFDRVTLTTYTDPIEMVYTNGNYTYNTAYTTESYSFLPQNIFTPGADKVDFTKPLSAAQQLAIQKRLIPLSQVALDVVCGLS